MFTVNAGLKTGTVSVVTSDEGGLSNEQLAEMAKNKIVSVSETAPEPIKQQAHIFADNVQNILMFYIDLAKKEERATICNRLRTMGHPDLADIIRRL